jgi:hypothetical protein
MPQHARWTAWLTCWSARPGRFDARLYRLLIRACYRAGTPVDGARPSSPSSRDG